MPRKRAGLAVFSLFICAVAAAQPPVDYAVSLARARQHLVHVRIHLAGTSAERDLQLPVWNALYQVRDFAQHVRQVTARNASGQALPVRKLDKTTWRVSQAESGAEVEYEIYADQSGPFGAQLNGEHAFFNLAQVLMYPVDARDVLMTVTFTDLPAGWRVATQLAALRPGAAGSSSTFTARNYDRLVDAPVEIGNFRETSVQEGGATYRIVVDANPEDYDLNSLAQVVRKVVATEVAWMNDRPFSEYLFIYHFPRGPGGGGMEHAYSTAIELGADRLAEDPLSLYAITAHEFFHLWNVKRIRPQSLEPIDYSRENYTTALWFAEGVTNTVADYMLLRAGVMDEAHWLDWLGRGIRTLELRPAHHTQSAEESSLDAWMEKYPQYRLAERSVSYYNKGEVLGVLLDLAVREASGGRKSLRDVFQWLNQRYARDSRYFPDSAGVRQAAEALTGADFGKFFRQYVAGVSDLPYNEYLRTVGLRLDRRRVIVPYPGFLSVRNLDSLPVVVTVEEGSEAERVGLMTGDTILTINGKPASVDLESRLESMRPGDTLKLHISGRKGQRDLKIKLAGREQDDFAIVNLENVTPAQRARRTAWLAGVSQAGEGPAGEAR